MKSQASDQDHASSESNCPRDAAPGVESAIRRAQKKLLQLQHEEGYWCGELIVDATLCADYVLYMHWAGQVDPVLQEKCVQHIRRRQQSDGGWAIYHGGPSEINATVKAYFALKLSGCGIDAPWMREARSAALRLGGIPRLNTYSKFYLALLGQFPWRYLPCMPVEIVLLPDWCPFNLYEMSSWSRAILVPLAILDHFKPTRQLPAELHLHELYPAGLEHSNLSMRADDRLLSRRNLFLVANRAARLLQHAPFRPIRNLALRQSVKWITERTGEGSDGLAAVFPAMLNTVMAFKALGYGDDHPLLKKALKDLHGLFVDDPQDFRIQPCLSPVWDTAINIIALVESGYEAASPEVERAGEWLAAREVRVAGDWKRKLPNTTPSGWAFEFNNEYYPDTDDTMMVLIALRLLHSKPDSGQHPDYEATIGRALRWLLSFQCADGGWAAFDKDVTRQWLVDMPFADHNAILDPTCSDLTGRMLELLGYIGFDRNDRVVRAAVAYLKRTQENDGSWYGRWGVNYIYGTWQVLRGLRAIAEDMRQDWIVRARDWLRSCQNEDGGWGESCASYDDSHLKGRGESTPSQTAWAIMGLCACGEQHSKAVHRAVEYLVRTQNADGSWTELHITGTGFPKVFYLRYDMYRNNFPLLALATYANYCSGRFHAPSRYQWLGHGK